MKLAKRIMVLMLVLSMLVGMLPAAVSATGESSGETTSATVDNGDLSIEGTNGFGSLLSEEITEQQEAAAEETSAGYTVTGLEIEGNIATVTYDSLEEATLVVALYTEDGLQMLLSGTTTVIPEETTATVTLEGDMPQYFMASAYLLDSYDMSPLCPSYDTPLYTKEMQELLASTVDDYDADRVLNLDEDKTTNFAVYAEDTIVIEPFQGVNTVVSADDSTLTYVIKNADKNIAGLKTGDVFAYPYNDEEILIAKVDTIKVSGTTATITGAELEMEEVFSAIKIESKGSSGEITVDDSGASEGIIYEGIVSDGTAQSVSGGAHVNAKHSFEIELESEVDEEHLGVKASISGSLDLQLDVELNYYIAMNQQYLEFVVKPSVTASVSVSGNITKKASLGYFAFAPVPGLYAGFEPELQLSFTGTVELSVSYSASLGVKIDSKTGVTNLTTKPKLDANLKAEVKVFFGIDLCPQVRIISKKVAQLELNVSGGVEIAAKTTGNNSSYTSEKAKTRHGCTDCLAMELNFIVNLAGSVKFLNLDWLTIEVDIAKFTIPLGSAYYSSDYREFAFGECPYVSYRTTLMVKDAEGKPVSGVRITKNKLQELGKTDKNGALITYLPFGTYVFSTEVDGKTVNRKADVTGACRIILDAGDMEPDFWDSVDHAEITDEGFGLVRVHAKLECGWNQAYAYTWGNWELGNWPGTEMTRNGDWYEVDMTGNHAHIIISNGESLMQTADVSIEMGVDVWIVVDEDYNVSVSYGSAPSEDGYTCGSRLKWSVEGDTLTISGSGRMSGYPYTDAPWIVYASDIRTVIIEEGITGLDKEVFSDCYNLERIVFYGDAPTFMDTSFGGVYGSVYYPKNNETWTEDVLNNYCGQITWKAYSDLDNLDDLVTVHARIPESWSQAGAYIWEPEDLGGWPGTQMVLNGDWYEIRMPGNHTTLIINDYRKIGNQTIDLTIEPQKDVWVVVHEDGTASISYSEEVVFMQEDELAVSNAVFGGSYETIEEKNYYLKTASFTDLVADEAYVLLVLASYGLEDPLSDGNLLYIAQGVADKDGKLTFQYALSKLTQTTYVTACGASNKNLEDAVVSFPEMVSNGEVQAIAPVVTYQNAVLVEGKDYVLLGDVDYTDGGEYVCYVRGIRSYTGIVCCEYSVASEGASVCGTVESFGNLDTVTVKLLQGTKEIFHTTADKNGCYTIVGVAAGAYTMQISKPNHTTREYAITFGIADVTQNGKICPIGDISGDGKINMKDWNVLYEHINEVNELTGYALCCADVNGDGKVNMKDWNRLYEHLTEVNPL